MAKGDFILADGSNLRFFAVDGTEYSSWPEISDKTPAFLRQNIAFALTPSGTVSTVSIYCRVLNSDAAWRQFDYSLGGTYSLWGGYVTYLNEKYFAFLVFTAPTAKTLFFESEDGLDWSFVYDNSNVSFPIVDAFDRFVHAITYIPEQSKYYFYGNYSTFTTSTPYTFTPKAVLYSTSDFTSFNRIEASLNITQKQQQSLHLGGALYSVKSDFLYGSGFVIATALDGVYKRIGDGAKTTIELRKSGSTPAYRLIAGYNLYKYSSTKLRLIARYGASRTTATTGFFEYDINTSTYFDWVSDIDTTTYPAQNSLFADKTLSPHVLSGGAGEVTISPLAETAARIRHITTPLVPDFTVAVFDLDNFFVDTEEPIGTSNAFWIEEDQCVETEYTY